MRTLLTLLACLFLAASLAAQSAHWSMPHFGLTVTSIGDVDGDGWGDLATTRKGSTYGYLNPGSVAVVSGRDGRVLLLFDHTTSPEVTTAYPFTTACGDLDADGFGDFAFTVEGDWMTFSGATFAPLFAPGGVPQGLGDVNGDGHDDLAVATTVQVLLLSGADGSAFLTIPITDSEQAQIYAQAGGDVNGDGTMDLVVSWSDYDGSAFSFETRIVSCVDGALIQLLDDVFIGGILPAGDLDADGHGDLFELTYLEARLLSGADLSTLAAFSDADFLFMQSMAAPGDVDRDGVPDLAVGGRSGTLDGPVVVFSGADGGVIAKWQASSDSLTWESTGSFATPGDLDADGSADLVVGCVPAQGATPDSGPLRPFSLTDKPIESLGGNLNTGSWTTGNSITPVLTATGSLKPESALTLRIANGLTGPAWIFAGATLEGGDQPAVVPEYVLPLAMDAEGIAQLVVRWPADASGLVMHLQARWPDGVTRSNIVRLEAP